MNTDAGIYENDKVFKIYYQNVERKNVVSTNVDKMALRATSFFDISAYDIFSFNILIVNLLFVIRQNERKKKSFKTFFVVLLNDAGNSPL